MSLGSPLAAFINKPSDVIMLFVLSGCTLFFLWVLFRGASLPDEDSEEREHSHKTTAEVSLGPGCFFVAQGYILVVVLLAIGMALVWSFQLLHPGH